MSRRGRRQLRITLVPLVALVAVGCTYDWLGVEPSGAAGGSGGVESGGGTAGVGNTAVGGAVDAGAGGGSAAGGTPSSGGSGGSGGISGGGAGGIAGGGSGGISGGGAGGVSGGGAGGEAGGGGENGVCPGNLVRNPGFENGTDNWIDLEEEGGSRGTFDVTTDLVPSGAAALSIDTTDVSPPAAADYRLVIASSQILVQPGETLSLSALAAAIAGDYGVPAVGLQFFDLVGDALPGLPALAEITSETVAPFELRVVVPVASTSARVIFELRNDIVLLADDVCLVREP